MAETDTVETQTKSYRNEKYVIIDTVIPSDSSYWVPQINGRQGDNMRPVNICLQHDGVDWNLGNYTVDLVGRDSKGVLKETNTVQTIVAEKGLICVAVPQQFYQAVGPYQESFLEIKDDAGTVVSSVRVAFTVWTNNTLVSRIESETYLQTIDQFMKNCEAMINTIQDNAQSAKQQIDALNDLLKTYQDLVKANAVALLNKEQTFGTKQTFTDMEVTGTLTAHHITGQAMDDILGAINAVPKVTTTKGTTGLVFGNGIAKSNDGNSLIVSKTDFGNGQWLIVGTGTVKLDLAAAVAGTIQLPWSIGKGNAIVADSFDYSNNIKWQLAGPGNGTIEMKAPQAVKQDSYWLNFMIGSIAY
ncbi:MAG TPA: phage baseplate upper protein [Limosilactobacillus coleohominis]|nr:phage baseplate upper protein [Limosilactobacillus coleohominis]